MKAEELAVIKERANKADYYSFDIDGAQIALISPQGVRVHTVDTGDDDLSEFIANAREDVPKLVAEVERLQKALEKIAKLPLSDDYSDAYYNEKYIEIVERAREALE